MLQIKRKEEYEKYSVLLEDGNMTVALDVTVFFATFGAVFGQKGIYVEEESEGEQSV